MVFNGKISTSQGFECQIKVMHKYECLLFPTVEKKMTTFVVLEVQMGMAENVWLILYIIILCQGFGTPFHG